MFFSKANIFTNIFFLISVIYTFIGLYGVSLDKKKFVNRLFLLLCLSLSWWTVCFAILTDLSINYEKTLFFNHISILGWGSFYGILYHFFTVISDTDNKISRNKILAIYLPVIINFIMFSPIIGESDYFFNMVKTDWGWTNVTPFNISNLYFTLYALIFSILSLIKIFKWSKNSVGELRQRTKILAIAYLCALVVGSFSDIFLNRFLGIHTIQIASICLIFPVLFMFYIIIKYNVIYPFKTLNTTGLIDDETRDKIFKTAGYIDVALAYYGVYFYYLLGTHKLEYVLQLSLYAYVLGIIDFFGVEIFKSTRSKYTFITTAIMASIFFIEIQFDFNVAVTVWALFFWGLLLTSVFENFTYTFILYIFMIMLQIYHLLKAPYVLISVDWLDYLSRMIIISMNVVVIYFINYLYRKKISENIEQSKMQKIIAGLSSSMIDVNIKNLDSKISEVLKKCNEHFGYVRSYYYHFDADSNSVELYYYEDELDDEKRKQRTLLDLGIDRFLYKKIVVFSDINYLDESQSDIKEYLKDMNLKGFYTFPIVFESQLRGILVFEFLKQKTIYSVYSYDKIISSLFVDTIRKLEYEKKLYYNANYDKITGIKNIDHFRTIVQDLLKDNSFRLPACIFIDINNFRSMNDSFGPSIGNAILKETARILSNNIDNDMVLARFAGDEFCLFIKSIPNKDKIELFVKDLLGAFRIPFTINNYDFKLNLNMGIALYPKDGSDIEQLIKNAKVAMNESKNTGKMSYRFCNDSDKERISEYTMYTNRLFNCLNNKELMIAYQPQMDIKTGKIIGAEALIRWKTEEFGIVPPFKFIPILEHTGLIVEVGEWIIQQVAIDQFKMVAMGLEKVRMAVNLSAVQFQDAKLYEKIEKILERYKVDPDYFEFEITESLAVNNSNETLMDNFQGIKSTGCSIAIDDFGVEFSSLGRLQTLPIDRLKIDKSFVDGIGVDKKKEAIVNMIINLAKALELDSIAEGVEEKHQLDYLANQGCDEIQGYYYAKPMFIEQFQEFLRLNS